MLLHYESIGETISKIGPRLLNLLSNIKGIVFIGAPCVYVCWRQPRHQLHV